MNIFQRLINRKIVVEISVIGGVCLAVLIGARMHIQSGQHQDLQDKLTRSATMTGRSVEQAIEVGFDTLIRLAADRVTDCQRAAVKLFNRETQMAKTIIEVGLVDPAGQILCTQVGRKLTRTQILPPIRANAAVQTIAKLSVPELDDTTLILSQNISQRRRLYVVLSVRQIQRVFRNAKLPASARLSVDLIDGSNLFARRTGPDGTDIRAARKIAAVRGAAGTGELDFEQVERDENSTIEMLEHQFTSANFPISVMATMQASQVQVQSLSSKRMANWLVFALFSLLVAGRYLWTMTGLNSRSWSRTSPTKHHQIIPYYQPIIDMRNGGLIGCEVLARWQTADGQVIASTQFIEQVEKSGEIIELTQDLIGQVAANIAGLFARNPHYSVGINLSGHHFSSPGVVTDFDKIFGKAGIEMGQIVIELGERKPLEDRQIAAAVVAQFHELGCKVALDDAGTGYVGLELLHELNLDLVKIDKVFVDTLVEDEGTSMIGKIVELARAVGKEVVAEGVEQPIQAERLLALGVEKAQGFLYAHPMPWLEFLAYVVKSGGDVSLIDTSEIELAGELGQVDEAA